MSIFDSVHEKPIISIVEDQDIGESDFATVKLGARGSELFAVKFLKNQHWYQEEFIKAFQESSVAKRIPENLHIARTVGFSFGHPCFMTMVTEQFGTSLDKVLVAQANSPEPDWKRMQWAHHVSKAMAFCHSLSPPVYHMGLKPSNVLIGLQEGECIAKVVDFESSVIRATVEKVKGHSISRSVRWDAPEVLILRTPSAPADVFSFGILLWQLAEATGVPPFCDADTPEKDVCALRTARPHTRPAFVLGHRNPAFVYLSEMCWDSDPSKRPQFQGIEAVMGEFVGKMKANLSEPVPLLPSPVLPSPPDEDHVPEHFCCPISQELMVDPVVMRDGHTYDREEITGWFALGKSTSPITGLELSDQNMVPNYALKSAISAYLERRSA